MRVLALQRWGQTTRVIISHPQGGTLSLPTSETSWEITSPPCVSFENKPLFDPKKLLHLSQRVEKVSTPHPSKASNCQQPKKFDNQKIDDETVQNPVNSPTRIQRAPTKIDQSNSEISRQNPRPRNQTDSTFGRFS